MTQIFSWLSGFEHTQGEQSTNTALGSQESLQNWGIALAALQMCFLHCGQHLHGFTSAVSLRGIKVMFAWINFKFGTRRTNCSLPLSRYFPVSQSHAHLPSLTTFSVAPFSLHFSKGTFQKKSWHRCLQSGSINAVCLHTVQVMCSAQVPESHSQLAVANFGRS